MVLIIRVNGLQINVTAAEFKSGILDKFMRVNGKTIKLKVTDE